MSFKINLCILLITKGFITNMAYGDNVTAQIFPEDFCAERNIIISNTANIKLMLTTGFPLFTSTTNIVSSKSRKTFYSNEHTRAAFEIVFDKPVVIYPGMLVRIENSEAEGINGVWRVYETSPDRKTITFAMKPKTEFNYTNGMAINHGSSVTFHIPGFDYQPMTVPGIHNNNEFFAFKGYDPSVTYKCGIINNTIEIYFSNGNNISLCKSGYKYTYIGDSNSFLAANKNNRAFNFGIQMNLMTVAYLFRPDYVAIHDPLNYQNNANSVSVYCFNPETKPLIEFFYVANYINSTHNIWNVVSNRKKLTILSPQIYKGSNEGKRTIYTRPWVLWENSQNFPIRLPGLISYITYESGLNKEGVWYTSKDCLYTVYKAEDYTKRPMIISLDDEFWKNDYIEQEWN